jgi:hypothetical protein
MAASRRDKGYAGCNAAFTIARTAAWTLDGKESHAARIVPRSFGIPYDFRSDIED